MSYTPSLSLVRLQELKLWQGSYDNLIQKQRSRSNSQSGNNRSSSSLDVSPNSSFHSMEKFNTDARELDNKEILPAKPFEQLLKEKLTEDTPLIAKPKPKRPFLKKGEGLARFRMGAVRLNSAGNGRTENKRQTTAKPALHSTKCHPQSILKKPHLDIDLSPLTIPDFVKPRGTWKQVFEDKSQNEEVLNENEKQLENYDEFRKSLGECQELQQKVSNVEEQQNETDPKFTNQEILEGLKAYAQQYFNKHNGLFCNDIPDNVCEVKAMSDLTLEELKMEKELKVFELLEKKTDRSSFCSTNTSVTNLLASTPQKFANKHKISQQIHEDIESIFPQQVRQDIQTQIQEVSDKTDVLQKFLKNLKNMDSQTQSYYSIGSDKKIAKSSSTETSFSDENTRWSSRSPSVTDNYTEYETTYQNMTKIDAGVNTSFDNVDKTIQNDSSCNECVELRTKYSETKLKLSEEICENTKLNRDLRELQKDYDKLRKQAKKDEEKHREKFEELQKELDNERKKFAKERSYFENYVRESQNRPSKKEREEITNLKQELADVKELLKLKETKTGATQARLRTQIKQQEKEIAEFKVIVEKLQKENAKLTANQKYSRRPQEVKMLHEINKNLSKLTEETFKKQMNKSKNENEDLSSKSSSVTEGDGDKENIKIDKETKKILSKDSRSETAMFNETPTIEQQYENVFGNLASPRNISTSLVEKTEKNLPDGSVEIMYSNGNLKTISADGKNIQIKYFNGDIKETDLNKQIIKYHYAAADSWHIQYPDGKEVMEFKDGQKCTKYTDGKTKVSYPDGSVRIINSDGTEESQFPDGRKTIKNQQGEVIILLPNGQREIHTQEYKRREYPDGTVRTLHKDGTVETVYANGRVRLKDANGVLIMDTHSNVD